MGRNKWSVTRFKTHQNGRSYGPAGKYRFETKLIAQAVYGLCQIEALFTGHSPWLSRIPTYQIDTELGIDFADEGMWRSYHIEASGDSLIEMIQNATVSEIDQDGGTIDAYGLVDASPQIENASLDVLKEYVFKQYKGSQHGLTDSK
jgi:hypothetical protein